MIPRFLFALALAAFVFAPLSGAAVSVEPSKILMQQYAGNTDFRNVTILTAGNATVYLSASMTGNTSADELRVNFTSPSIVERNRTIPIAFTRSADSPLSKITVTFTATTEVAEIIREVPSPAGSSGGGGGGGLVGGTAVKSDNSTCFYSHRVNGTLRKIPCHIVPEVVDNRTLESTDADGRYAGSGGVPVAMPNVSDEEDDHQSLQVVVTVIGLVAFLGLVVLKFLG